MLKNNTVQKPQRLYFKSYLQIVRNSVGSHMFRTFYAKTPSRGEFDTFNDGEYSCAFFVSSLLVIFKKIDAFHGLVSHTVEDMKKSGWQTVSDLKPGDVLVWEAKQFDNDSTLVEHIGFYIGDDKAVSTSSSKKAVVEHDKNFGAENRKIISIFRMLNWEDDTQASRKIST